MEKPRIFSYPNQFIKNHYRVGYQNQNWLQKNYNCDFIAINLDDYYLKLREQLTYLLIDKHILNAPVHLENLHEHINDELKTYGNDGIGKVGTFLYETDEPFKKILHEFIHEVLYKKILQQAFLFQATTTFRVHCPNASNSNFFPHYHTDLALGHPPYEMNLWIPLTAKLKGHGFYIASLKHSRMIADYLDYDLPSLMHESTFRDSHYLEFCKQKFTRVEIEAGQGLLFDGRCFHTAMPIKDHTRISIDFRIVLQNDFINAEVTYENRGIRKQLLLLPNDYYYPLAADELS
jgi:hypothetical protein